MKIIETSGIDSDNPLWEIKTNFTQHVSNIPRGFEYEYIKHALPDIFQTQDISELPLNRYRTALNNPNAYRIFWHYATSRKVRQSYFELIEQDVAFKAEVYEYFQDIVMEHFVVRRDLVVEILPTSNILITPIDNYENHPFLRLRPPDGNIVPNRFDIRKESIKIVLGTDDPGIQGTNFIMEMYLIKNVISKQYGKTIAQNYIDEICRFSGYLFSKNKNRD
jgi:hypothetical protein